jgi:tRNA (cmo5U34)-methyltransferase
MGEIEIEVVHGPGKPETAVDRTEPDGAWAFDESVTAVFEDMLARSIPQYDVMRETVTRIACSYVPRGTARGGIVTDLGASRGDALAPIIDRCGANARYNAVEVSEPMAAALRERWPVDRKQEHGVTVYEEDLRNDLTFAVLPPADVTLSVLTLQFTPIEYRQRILRAVYKNTKPGGALILIEKVLGGTADLDRMMRDLYYELKGRNGYSPEQIERKRLSLEGVLVPVTAAMNEDLLRGAGFREVDSFWRWCNFAGWIAVRATD